MKQAITLAMVLLVSLLSIAQPAQAYECISAPDPTSGSCPPGSKQPEPKAGEMTIRMY